MTELEEILNDIIQRLEAATKAQMDRYFNSRNAWSTVEAFLSDPSEEAVMREMRLLQSAKWAISDIIVKDKIEEHARETSASSSSGGRS